jgi:hypothetical protein
MKNVTLKTHENSIGVYVDGVLFYEYARWEDAKAWAVRLRSIDRDRLDRCTCVVPCPGFKCDQCDIEKSWCLKARLPSMKAFINAIMRSIPIPCSDCGIKNGKPESNGECIGENR